MKVGLIGNMNNNNFAIMRYFRDLGVDAHLLLYSNDGKEALSHFIPEADTWEIDKWKKYIHQTSIPASFITTLDFPLSWLISLRTWFRMKRGKINEFIPAVTKAQINATFSDFDFLIGSGPTPAILFRVRRFLDIFYPYSISVEFVHEINFLSVLHGSNKIYKKIYSKVQKQQINGIKNAHNVLNFESGSTQNVLIQIGVIPKLFSIPMVYTNGYMPLLPPNKFLSDIELLIKESDFSILSHSRLVWIRNKKFNEEQWKFENKNNHWLIQAFAEFIQQNSHCKPRLLIVEYGPDVLATKELISRLGINEYVNWLPKMARRELMWILSKVTIGAGEFYEVPKIIWGGTGWEVLASGKPLLQGFNFQNGEFEKLFGFPEPPILKVKNQADILLRLVDVWENEQFRIELGDKAKKWFENYNGVSVAKEWLSLLENRNKL